jgi:hypothetical protein
MTAELTVDLISSCIAIKAILRKKNNDKVNYIYDI